MCRYARPVRERPTRGMSSRFCVRTASNGRLRYQSKTVASDVVLLRVVVDLDYHARHGVGARPGVPNAGGADVRLATNAITEGMANNAERMEAMRFTAVPPSP